jgi:hypothetical protein
MAAKREFTHYKGCRTCGKEKPVSEFYVCYYRKGVAYYRTDCIECYKPKRNEDLQIKRATDPTFRLRDRERSRARYVPGRRNEYMKQWRQKRKEQKEK